LIQAIIFDLDDTLISEKEYVLSGYRHIADFLAKKHQVSSEVLYRQMVGLFEQSSKQVFNRLLNNYGIPYQNETIQELVWQYHNHIPDIHYYSDVIPTINKLKNSDIFTGIISDGYAITQRRKLSVLRAYDTFDNIVLTDELGREYWKPHQLSFEMMHEHFQVPYESMIYVGDNPEKDFYIRTIYPIVTVRIEREYGVYKSIPYFKGVKEQYCINNLSEIVTLLK